MRGRRKKERGNGWTRENADYSAWWMDRASERIFSTWYHREESEPRGAIAREYRISLVDTCAKRGIRHVIVDDRWMLLKDLAKSRKSICIRLIDSIRSATRDLIRPREIYTYIFFYWTFIAEYMHMRVYLFRLTWEERSRRKFCKLIFDTGRRWEWTGLLSLALSIEIHDFLHLQYV